jgi:ATP-dependent Clp protease ATP-binding subunit ClpA
MFEGFTERARRVVVMAQEQARVLNHNYIGTEHLLLGLIREDEGVAARALAALGISLTAVRQQVVEIIGRGRRPPSGHVPLTPETKQVLELARREATALGYDYVGTEHILLGLVRERKGIAAQVLVQFGADLNRVRQQVIRLLHDDQGREPDYHGPPTEDSRIVLRTGEHREDDPIVDHPGQPADYVHSDGTVWTWQQRWRLVGGVRDGERIIGRVHLRAYDLVTPVRSRANPT